jgi:DnaJ-class molecular chaperone
MTKSLFVTIDDDNAPEGVRDVELPSKQIECTYCQGRGSHCRHLGAFTQEGFDEAFDEQGKRDYLDRLYDKPCERCEGTGKQVIVDRKACPKDLLKEWDDQQEAEREARDEARMESMMLGEY